MACSTSLDPIDILANLVAAPSVNPRGSPCGATCGEAQLTARLEQLAQDLGLRTERQSVAPGRDNLLVRFDGRGSIAARNRPILFCAHQDTVQTDGMTIEPFVPTVRDGRLYGRGACDTKGGMAAMLATTGRLAADAPAAAPAVVLACTVDEEHGFTGVGRLTQSWQSRPAALLADRPVAAIVTEPTDLDIVVAHKGVIRWCCRTTGRAVHSSRPEAGENAIYRMAHVVVAIERYAAEVLGRAAAHPRCGGPTISVGTIHGGAGVNTVPERCGIEIDLRVPPGESPAAARQQLIEYLDGAGLREGVLHDPPSMQGPAFSDADNARLGQRLRHLVESVAGPHRLLGVPYASEAAFLAEAGVPTVVFGPGHLDQAHTADEWVAIDKVRQAAEVFYRLCLAGGPDNSGQETRLPGAT